MTRQILFIQGGGDGGYEADLLLVHSLQENLGNEYEINYPELKSDETAPDFGWIRQINQKVLQSKSDVILVAHSLGASMVLKYLSEHPVDKKIKGAFLIATPFWSGNEDWKTGLKLKKNFANKLPGELPLYFYHCKDDESAPFSHFGLYKQKITQAIFREIKIGGHQIGNDLTLVANDIKALK